MTASAAGDSSSSLQSLLARHDPDPSIPLPVLSHTYRHTTWARTFHSRPELYLQPTSIPEIQKIVTLARRCRRRIVVVGSGHSPSDLTMTSSWLLNLDKFSEILHVDKAGGPAGGGTIIMQAGIRLKELNARAKEHGLTMANLGSIDVQSVAGAFATGTHGSSLSHGLLSEDVVSLRLVLGNGQVVRCSANENGDLFRAALVSLGALGIVVEVEYRMVRATNIEWVQSVITLDQLVERWGRDFWAQEEFVRVWWLPYVRQAVVWRAHKTDEPVRPPKASAFGGAVWSRTYHMLLWASYYVPRLTPWVEWFVMGLQHGFRWKGVQSAIQEQRHGLLMDCLFSQFVNEWAIPLSRGPEAIKRFDAWLHHDEKTSAIPFDSRNIFIHCPIEVRVGDSARKAAGPKPFLDFGSRTEPSLYMNAIMYRPYELEPACTKPYYEAFEYLMKELDGKPHWAKNFMYTDCSDLSAAYGDDLQKWRKVRAEVDPDGVFVGDWLRRLVLGDRVSERHADGLKCEETQWNSKERRSHGNLWNGRQLADLAPKLEERSAMSSESSFDHLAGAEAEASRVFEAYSEDGESTDGGKGLELKA